MPSVLPLSARFSPPRAVEVRLADGRLAVVGVLIGDAVQAAVLERLVGRERSTAEADLR